MKNLFYLLLLCVFFQSETFNEKIFNDFTSNSRYLKISIKSSEYNGICVIENDDLFLYYTLKYNKGKTEYLNFIKGFFSAKEILDLGNEKPEKWNFKKVLDDKKVNQNLKKGLNKFINIYFNKNLVERGKTTENQKALIIKILFDHNKACSIDDETGFLIIRK
ncbi:hypothetical protein [Flavobacterium sp.]|uniref:hypothetical protein n=1 Tax=Flavobacterium sp. TaxID=239 RepID=UPI00262F3AC8|nr:hypothetical protein [Flavobacterium sp.]